MLAELIRVERARQKITQTELAARLGIGQATLSRLEAGDPVLGPRLLLRLSAFLRLPVDEIVRLSALAQDNPPARESQEVA